MSIPKGWIMKIPHAGPDLQVMCISGMIWLTRENDYADHLMGEQACCLLSGPGLVIVEALEDSVVQVMHTCRQAHREGYRRSCHSCGILPRASRF